MLTTLHGNHLVIQCDNLETGNVMAKRKRRRYDAYHTLKSQQHVTSWATDKVHDWEIDDMFIDPRGHLVNKRRRSRLGYIQGRRPR